MLTSSLLPLVFSRQQARLHGLTDHAIDWRIARGRWRVLRRGVFCRAEAYESATLEQRHLLGTLALSVGIGEDETASHLSAALAFGWPAPITPDQDPWTTVASESQLRTRRRQGRVRQVAPLPGDHVTARSGLILTSAARTVADCLRHLPADESVPIADGALADGVDPELVRSILTWQATWPYAARGDASSRLVDGRRQSWLESSSAVTFHRIGIALPEPQMTIFDERGNFVARVDYLWEGLGIVGEADGWGKYGLPAATGPGAASDPMRALREEKVRQDRLRDLGFEVVRWTLWDLTHPHALRARIDRAIARARPDLIRGTRRRAATPSAQDLHPANGLIQLRHLVTNGALMLPPAMRHSRQPGELTA
jgi:hypothetical protein